MATIYKVEVVSHWINYTKEQLEEILLQGIKAKWSHHQQYIRPKIIWWNEINKI